MVKVTFDWSECSLVEVIPGKVSGVPLLNNTRLPVEALTRKLVSTRSRLFLAIAPPISFRRICEGSVR